MPEPRDNDQEPALKACLDFLDQDMRRSPERSRGISPDLVERFRALAANASVDLDQPIHGPVAL